MRPLLQPNEPVEIVAGAYLVTSGLGHAFSSPRPTWSYQALIMCRSVLRCFACVNFAIRVGGEQVSPRRGFRSIMPLCSWGLRPRLIAVAAFGGSAPHSSEGGRVVSDLALCSGAAERRHLIAWGVSPRKSAEYISCER